jgi:exosome complex component RRP43
MTAAPELDTSLGSAIFARLHPSTYLSRFLSSNIRPDGRSLDAFRDSTLALSSIQSAEGSCIVRQGSTVIVAGVKAELLDTTEEDDQAGSDEEGEEEEEQQYGLGSVDRKRLIIGVELSPMASARFKSGPPGEESQVLTSQLTGILENCPPLNRSSLVIAKGISTWCLYVDLVCLSFDGNAVDAALLAINGALQDTRLPQAALDEETNQIICSPDPSKRHSLFLTACPLSCSFGVVEGTYLLSDPDAFESSLVTSTIRITIEANRASEDDIVNVHCTGVCSALISPIEANQASVKGSSEEKGQVRVKDEDLIAVCIHRARRRCKDLTGLLSRKA